MGLRDRLKRRVRQVIKADAPQAPTPPLAPRPAPAPAPAPAPQAPAAPPAPAPQAPAAPPAPAASDAPLRNAHYKTAFATTHAACTVRIADPTQDRWLEFPCEPGETVLDAAERAGLVLSFSCRSGGCLVCAAKLLEGEVDQGEQYVLEDEHLAEGYRLLCCTTVRSDASFLGDQEDAIT